MTKQELKDAMTEYGFSNVDQVFQFIEDHGFAIMEKCEMVNAIEREQIRREKLKKWRKEKK